MQCEHGVFAVFLTMMFFISVLCSCAARAGGADEIQVYTDAINAPGAFGLELHGNYVPDGISQPAYLGDAPSQDSFRVTYLVVDTTQSGINFNLGVGRGWTQGSDN